MGDARMYLGGGGHWAMAPPPFGHQNSVISIEKYANLWHGPLFVTWAEGLSTETVGEDLFWPKIVKNLSEDLFFWSSSNFGKKNGLGFGLENFHSGLHQSQIFWPPPPPFEKPAYATGGTLLQPRPNFSRNYVIPSPQLCFFPETRWRQKKNSSPKIECFFPQIKRRPKKKKLLT